MPRQSGLKFSLCCLVGSLLWQGLAVGQVDDAAVQMVIDALKGDDPAMQSAAISLVREMPGEEVTKALAEQLPNLTPTAQVQLLAALADRGDKAALPAVVEAADYEDESVRIAALQAMARLGDASSVELLVSRAATSTGAEQRAARESLYRLRGKEIDKTILSSISSETDPKVKVELIKAVSERNIVEGVKICFNSARDADVKIQRESIKALKVIATPMYLPELVKLVLDVPSESVRSEVEKIVAAEARKIDEQGKRVEVVLAALPGAMDLKSRCSLLSVLGKIGDDAALPVLREALADSEAEVRATAIRALSDWPNAKPLNDLQKVAKDSKIKLHQILALRGYVRLISLDDKRSASEILVMYKEAMELAPNTAEKKRVLSGLANTQSLEVLQMAAWYLDNDALKQEAAVAVVKIAGGIHKNYPNECKELLMKIIGSTDNDALREQAQELINQIGEAGK